MKKIPQKIIWILLTLTALYLILNAALITFGKAIIISQIEKNLKFKAALSHVSLSFPLSINISKLEVGDLLKADSISISPSILGFLAGKIVLNELKIVNPEITIVRSAQGRLNLPQFESKGKQPPLLLAGLKINQGRFIFIDKKINPEGHRVALNNINADISKVVFPPASLDIKFNISAGLVDSDNKSAGSVLALGWIDFGHKDMDGKIELKDIDGTSLAPYYQNIFSNKKLLSTRLNFTADLKAENNNLIAKCRLEFSNLVYEELQPFEGKTQVSDILPSILNIFSDASGNLVLNFTIATKLDNPRIDLVSLKGNIGQAAVENVASQSPEKVIEKVKEAAEEFKEIGKSLKEIFKKED